ncbi:outer membrane protein assembly factor BamD [Candidatus Pelagibacter sp. HIMB1321]|jgi:outer membrane protein assembly factor BamD|uniref:outer membrane protein assembly factor BamD n=1 Tax=Candidatus Pelagibacter sp. HIMB1321 TaxID=1388755 RepID=UPI000A081BC7|nr:outer membrane protein assembly factor BamD [Candidatus Pelagibacter sp. HIMB1321]SMF71349.1 Beta-barrel assembly machine subunit BamD [Candidatus Pelagibacter sp. HIMB1321]
MFGFKLILILIFILNTACSKNEKQVSIIKEKDLNSQLYEAYSEGIEALEKGDVIFAAKKFNEAEILYPQSEWAPKSSLMAAYSYYVQDYYSDAIAELERFIKVYSTHKNLDYAYYLLAICYYEQIVDEKKDLQSIIQAKKYFILIKNNYQNSEYALDADFKIDLINDIIASKEIYLGRYYLEKKKWIAAINRFRTVIDEYDTTIYAEEALHRLVEVHYLLGLNEEAEKYAKLLGYNYQSSRWYEQSYSLFDKNYEIRNREIKKDKDSKLIKRFKSIFK